MFDTEQYKMQKWEILLYKTGKFIQIVALYLNIYIISM